MVSTTQPRRSRNNAPREEFAAARAHGIARRHLAKLHHLAVARQNAEPHADGAQNAKAPAPAQSSANDGATPSSSVTITPSVIAAVVNAPGTVTVGPSGAG